MISNIICVFLFWKVEKPPVTVWPCNRKKQVYRTAPFATLSVTLEPNWPKAVK